MAKKIIIASGKGGVGKSTIAVFLAKNLAMRGKRVLLLDADIGLSALDILFDVGEKVIYNWCDALDDTCENTAAIVTVNSGISLLPAPFSLGKAINYNRVGELLSSFDAEYDYILIDAPAGIGEGVMCFADAVDMALVIATPDEVSVRGAFNVAALLEKNGAKLSRLIVNRYRSKAVKNGKLLDLDSVIDKTGVRLIGIIPEDDSLVYASVTHNDLKKNSSGSKAFSRVAARLEGENVALAKF